MTTTPTPTDLPPETEALVLAVLEARVKDAKALARIPLGPLYADGEKRVIRSPLDGAKLGTVYRTDPAPKWTVVDRNLLADHLCGDPDNVEYIDDISGTPDQVVEVLAEYAPHLLARVERVTAAAINAAVAAAAAGGEVLPGIERVKPSGSLAVRPDPAAGTAIEALVAARWITYDGKPLEILAAEIVEEPVEPPSSQNLVCPGCSSSKDLYERLGGRVLDGQMWHTGCANMAEQKRAAAEVAAHDAETADEGIARADMDEVSA